MADLILTPKLLLIIAIILYIAGAFFFFFPHRLIKWNEIGNTWLGGAGSAVRHAGIVQRLFTADYAIFTNHRTSGGILWGWSSLLLFIYLLYR